MTTSDAELLEKARTGDSAAVDEILARHERQVFRFGLRMCGNEEDARDVLQDTLLAAFRNLNDFRGDAQLSTWLYQIARSYCLKSRRRGMNEPQETEPLEQPEAAAVPSAEAAPDAKAHAREIGSLLQAAILSLPESHREVLVLRDVEGLSAEEAARVVGIEVGALKSRLHRARAQLRERMVAFFGVSGKTEGGAPCPGLAAELAAYAAEDIDQATCARIEEHLKHCERCSGACAALQRTVSLCRQIPGDEVPFAVRTAVRAALLGLRPQA
ncbi:MAG TPA: sigma-70 family RNA polymerase sigma factor [Myxococcales bacterium]